MPAGYGHRSQQAQPLSEEDVMQRTLTINSIIDSLYGRPGATAQASGPQGGAGVLAEPDPNRPLEAERLTPGRVQPVVGRPATPTTNALTKGLTPEQEMIASRAAAPGNPMIASATQAPIPAFGGFPGQAENPFSGSVQSPPAMATGPQPNQFAQAVRDMGPGWPAGLAEAAMNNMLGRPRGAPAPAPAPQPQPAQTQVAALTPAQTNVGNMLGRTVPGPTPSPVSGPVPMQALAADIPSPQPQGPLPQPAPMGGPGPAPPRPALVPSQRPFILQGPQASAAPPVAPQPDWMTRGNVIEAGFPRPQPPAPMAPPQRAQTPAPPAPSGPQPAPLRSVASQAPTPAVPQGSAPKAPDPLPPQLGQAMPEPLKEQLLQAALQMILERKAAQMPVPQPAAKAPAPAGFR